MTYRSERRELVDYGFARVRDLAFEAVRELWRKRESEGWTQAQLAEKLGRDPAWVSRKLGAPGNWTLKTFGAFVEALDGEAEIMIHDLNVHSFSGNNFNAYDARSSVSQSANLQSAPTAMRSNVVASNAAPIPAMVE
jgi:hypothetical protein